MVELLLDVFIITLTYFFGGQKKNC